MKQNKLVIQQKNCIYLSDTPVASLLTIELIYKTQNLKNLTLFLNTPNEELEKNLLNLQSYILNQNCPITINNCNWKNKALFRPIFQELLNSYKNQKVIIVVEAKSLKMFHTHFIYKDLLKEFHLTMMVFSKFKNLVWTYSPQQLKWLEISLNQKGLYFRPLEVALRNSKEEETDERFSHTIRVVKTAWEIMLSLNTLKEGIKTKVLIACAYHDFAKNWPLEKLQSSFIKKHPKIKDCPIWALHGPVAAYRLQDSNLIKDTTILRAIECHTIPPKRLNFVGKILVISDKIEPFKENNFSGKIFQELWTYLKKGNYEYVYEYLRLNPKIRK